MTAYVSPGLFRSGAFTESHGTLFGLSDQAGFAAITFAGLWLGSLLLGPLADRVGRRMIFTCALLTYGLASGVMAFQSTALSIFAWRFIAGLGVGCQMVTIDAYISELIPGALRGRAFALSQGVMFCAVPIVALLSWVLLPYAPLGLDGWRAGWCSFLRCRRWAFGGGCEVDCRSRRVGLLRGAGLPRLMRH